MCLPFGFIITGRNWVYLNLVVDIAQSNRNWQGGQKVKSG